ncbi:MAG: hypothetical protein M3Y37_01850, partial [Chloroflexota bacterium]|nr:hypothetical protein [Chloroflexota bacterium]
PQTPLTAGEILALRYDLGMTAKNFAATLGTEFRMYEDWIAGKATPPDYFLKRMHEMRASIGTANSVPVLAPEEIREIRAASGLNIYKFAARVDASASEILEGESGSRMVRPQTNRNLVALREVLARERAAAAE